MSIKLNKEVMPEVYEEVIEVHKNWVNQVSVRTGGGVDDIITYQQYWDEGNAPEMLSDTVFCKDSIAEHRIIYLLVNPYYETEGTTFLTAKLVSKDKPEEQAKWWELDWVLAEFWGSGDIRLIFNDGKAVMP